MKQYIHIIEKGRVYHIELTRIGLLENETTFSHNKIGTIYI